MHNKTIKPNISGPVETLDDRVWQSIEEFSPGQPGVATDYHDQETRPTGSAGQPRADIQHSRKRQREDTGSPEGMTKAPSPISAIVTTGQLERGSNPVTLSRKRISGAKENAKTAHLPSMSSSGKTEKPSSVRSSSPRRIDRRADSMEGAVTHENQAHSSVSHITKYNAGAGAVHLMSESSEESEDEQARKRRLRRMQCERARY